MSNIKYWTPVHNAWDKMVEVLFRPFQMGKWMVIGFTAFLANCGRDSGGGNNFNYNHGGGGSSCDSGSCDSGSECFGEDIENTLSEISNYISDAWAEYSGLIIIIGSAVILLIIVLTVLVNWLNSRGQFMFLDNVIRNRAAVEDPWREYRQEGNSLMLFQIFMDLLGLVSVLALVVGFLAALYPMIVTESFCGRNLFGMIALILLLIFVCLVFGFVQMVLTHFVVPLMYQRRISVRNAFKELSPILKNHFWRIVLFGLVMALVNGAVGVALVIGVLLTCCTALIILIIPYIGTVALLPLFVFRRFLGPEFLRQFGGEYDLLGDFTLQGAVADDENGQADDL